MSVNKRESHRDYSLKEGQTLAPEEVSALEEVYEAIISGIGLSLKQEKNSFRSLAQSAPIMLWMLDVEGNLLFANQAYLDYMGQDFEKFRGQGWQEVIHPEDLDRISMVITDAMSKHEPFSVEVRVKKADGAYRWILASGSPKFTDGKVEYVGTSQDITNHKLVELKLEADRRNAEAANKRRGVYLTQMTHELRTPLHTIISASSMCLDEMLGPLPPKVMDYLEMIHKSGEHLLKLINDMLDMSKIEYGKLTVKPQELNLRDFLQETLQMMEPLAEQKKQGLAYHQAEDLPEILYADPIRLRQAIINLFSNAHKFTPEGKRIEMACIREGDCIVFSVTDEGPGISEEDMEIILQPFEQGTQEHQTRTKGLGLGLPIAKRIIDLHQGRLTIESKLGEGSKFSIYLPIQETKPSTT